MAVNKIVTRQSDFDHLGLHSTGQRKGKTQKETHKKLADGRWQRTTPSSVAGHPRRATPHGAPLMPPVHARDGARRHRPADHVDEQRAGPPAFGNSPSRFTPFVEG